MGSGRGTRDGRSAATSPGFVSAAVCCSKTRTCFGGHGHQLQELLPGHADFDPEPLHEVVNVGFALNHTPELPRQTTKSERTTRRDCASHLEAVPTLHPHERPGRGFRLLEMFPPNVVVVSNPGDGERLSKPLHLGLTHTHSRTSTPRTRTATTGWLGRHRIWSRSGQTPVRPAFAVHASGSTAGDCCRCGPTRTSPASRWRRGEGGVKTRVIKNGPSDTQRA